VQVVEEPLHVVQGDEHAWGKDLELKEAKFEDLQEQDVDPEGRNEPGGQVG